MDGETKNVYPMPCDAEPVQGNYTTEAGLHLWCAHALSALVSSPDTALEEFNDDIQEAVRFLLHCEVQRAMNAQKAAN